MATTINCLVTFFKITYFETRRIGATWWWVNHDRNFIFGWTIFLKTVSTWLNVSPKLLDLGLQVKFLHKLYPVQSITTTVYSRNAFVFDLK